MLARVALVVDNSAELELMSEVIKIFDEFEIKFKEEVLSFYYNPDKVMAFAKSAKKAGFEAIIATGAHLPVMLASSTIIPVIRLAEISENFEPDEDVPVATMTTAKGVAIFALQILANSDERIANKLEAYRDIMKNIV